MNPLLQQRQQRLKQQLLLQLHTPDVAVPCSSGIGGPNGDPAKGHSGGTYESSLVLALCRLQHQASAAMRGSLAEIEGKCTSLRLLLLLLLLLLH